MPVKLVSAAVGLCIQPPERAESGSISILVARASTRERVPVEFQLEACASGAKCYSF